MSCWYFRLWRPLSWSPTSRSACWYWRWLGWNGWVRKLWVVRCNFASVMSESWDIDTFGLPVAIFELWFPVSLADVGVDSLAINDHQIWWCCHWMRTEMWSTIADTTIYSRNIAKMTILSHIAQTICLLCTICTNSTNALLVMLQSRIFGSGCHRATVFVFGVNLKTVFRAVSRLTRKAHQLWD